LFESCALTELPDHLMAAVWPSELWLVGSLLNKDLSRALCLAPSFVHRADSSILREMGLWGPQGTMVFVGQLLGMGEGMDRLEHLEFKGRTIATEGSEAMGRVLGRRFHGTSHRCYSTSILRGTHLGLRVQRRLRGTSRPRCCASVFVGVSFGMRRRRPLRVTSRPRRSTSIFQS